MSCIKPSVVCEPLIDICNRHAINSSHCKIFEIDLYTVKKEDLDFTAAYEITFDRRETLNGIISWFDIFFDKLPNKVEFTTDPYSKSTNWKQVVFYTNVDMKVERGEKMTGSIAVRKSNTNFRELDVKISYHLNGKNSKNDFYQIYNIH
jgi:protein arginine N-methyltransferase 1